MATPTRVDSEQAQLLAAAIEETSEGILITDACLNEPGPTIVFANAAFGRITGYDPEEVIGKTPRLLQGPQTDRRELMRLRRELEAAQHFHGQTVNYRKDGSPFLMDWKISPVRNTGGRVTHYVAIQRDITAERLESDSRDQTERVAAVGQITGEIAHDFNNLLMGMSSLAKIIQEDLNNSDLSQETVKDLLGLIDRSMSLTRQLLDFSRIKDNAEQDIDLHELLQNIQRLLRRLAGECVRVQLPVPQRGCVVRAASTDVEQILINLVLNARDAMPNGGEIRIHIQPRLLEATEAVPQGIVPGNYVEVTVSDTGIGMNEATKARIFEPFFTTKPKGQGTGLGLATVRGHVQRLRGLIAVESEVEKGSHFKICLPASL